jgi:hypothetical protein
MADIRIKDLATLESASLTGDVFVIDGTTGTRKLSAFSPSFGGNATVTGTLTVNGASTMNGALTLNINASTIGKSGSGNGGNWRFVSDDGTTRWLSGILGGAGETSFSIYDIANSRSLLTATAAGVVQINQTTASTSTSSGALVVSGGVGVAGAIVTGGNIGVGSVNPVVAYNSTGSIVGSGQDPQVRLSATGSSGWAFSTYANTAADGKWSAGLNAGANRYIITNDLDLSGTAALSILPTTLDATFGGALLATGTLTANAASNAFRITNSQTPASAAATGTAGTIAWDSSYIYVCTATNTWKRVAIATW